MKAERAIFDQLDPDAAAFADARAEGDIRAGRLVGHAEVAAWPANWGTGDERPARRNGSHSLGARP